MSETTYELMSNDSYDYSGTSRIKDEDNGSNTPVDERESRDKDISMTSNWNVHEVVADDYSFCINLDNQIRSKFARWEVEKCLPAAKMVWARCDVPDLALKDYPIEGYYYKSPEQKELFKKIRNIQQNEELFGRVHKDEQLEFLRSVYDSDIFGNPPVKAYPWPDAPLKRRWDLMTYIMSDETIFPDNVTNYPWSIPKVMENLKKHLTGRPNMVELAGLIGDERLITAVCESNALGRMYCVMSGSYSMGPPRAEYIWKVSKEVHELGRKIVKEYNKVMGVDWESISMDDWMARDSNIILPTADNMKYLSWDALEVPRVTHLGYVIAKKLNYFWILDYTMKVYDIYTRDFITTENYIEMTKDHYKV